MMPYIAHEMGNPLTGLLGFAQLIATDADHPLAPEQADRLKYVLSTSRQLQALMRDVLDLGRLETGKLTIDLCPVDAARCAQDAPAAVSALAGQAGVMQGRRVRRRVTGAGAACGDSPGTRPLE